MKSSLVISLLFFVHLIVSDAKPQGGLNLDGIGSQATSVGAKIAETTVGRGSGTGSSALKTVTDSGTSVTKKVTDSGTGVAAETGDGGLSSIGKAAKSGAGVKGRSSSVPLGDMAPK